MRILRLDLHAFGPFTGGRLDFARKPDALQLIYGPNEAGKSTTLRALLALLYGIPVRTNDAHLHDMARLRIGALLEDHRGRVLSLTRRKGAKHTLLDANGEPTPESALSELLLGIDETMFRHMFGLDHQRLRDGGEALLSGNGNLGEGLFDASVGTRALREVKEALRSEAEALYKARGKTPKLNVALEALRDKTRQIKEAALSPQAFVEQTKALEQRRKRREQCLVERRELLTERARLERDLRLLPLLARHAQLADAWGRLMEPDDAPTPVPARALTEERLLELERRYGAALSFEAELPRATAELSALTREIEALTARLGSAAVVKQVVDTPLRTRWRKQVEAQSAALRKLAELAESRRALSVEVAQNEAALAQEGALEADPALSVAIERIEREDVPNARARAEAEAERRAVAVVRALAQLGVSWAKAQDARATCARLVEACVPDEPSLAALEQRDLALDAAAARAVQRRREIAESSLVLSARQAELLSQGELSTHEQLVQARSERDAALSALTQEPSRWSEVRLAVERADMLADKLLHEALRSAEVGRLTRELAQLAAQREELAVEERARTEQRAELSAALAQLQAATGLAESSPRALRTKLAKLTAAGEAARDALTQLQLCETLRRREQELAQMLAELLGDTPGAAPPSLERLLGQAHAQKRAHDEKLQRIGVLTARRRELAARMVAEERRAAELTQQQSSALAALQAELRERGFPAALGHDEVLACLDDLALLADAERRRTTLIERLDGARAQRDALARDVADAVQETAPGALALPLGEQLAALTQSAQSRRESQRDDVRLRQELAASERELTELGDGADLSTLRARAHEQDPSAMRARLLEIEAQLAQLDEEVGVLDQNIGGLEVGLTTVTEAPHAVPIAEEVEGELANVRALTRRYLEVRLSLSLLAREVERHRAQHQGPLVTRASALFSSLTLGRYTGLSVELDDQDEPLLCALANTGKTVRVAGLSDGTRDQLYLALRIASIERFLAVSPALPLVLDDAFIHFDDARAEVALLALHELSKKTQILFFTHHARMVELAKRALKPSQLALHELDPVRGTVAFRDNGPLFAGA